MNGTTNSAIYFNFLKRTRIVSNKFYFSLLAMKNRKITRLRQVLSKKSEGRRLISNFLSLSFLQIAGYVFPLLTIPYLAHVIGVNYYGEIAFALAINIYFQTIVDYGFIFSSVRDIARCRDNKEKVSEIYSSVMSARFFLVLVSFLSLLILICIIPKFWIMKWVLILTFLTVVGHAMFPDWMFQALEKMKYITIFNIAVKLLFTVAVFIFIRKPEDYLLQPILTAIGYIICGIGSMWLIHKWGIQFYFVKFTKIKELLKSNFDLFINQIIPNLYNSASVILLGFFHGDAANGIYDAGNRFASAGVNLFSIISRTFYPFLSRRMDKHLFFRRLNIGMAIVVAVSLYIISPYIINHFFPNNFDGALPVLRILSISIIFIALSNVFGTNWLILNGYESKMRRITLWSSIIGLTFGIPAVYFWSYYGVAYTVFISRAIIGIWSWYTVSKLKKIINT